MVVSSGPITLIKLDFLIFQLSGGDHSRKTKGSWSREYSLSKAHVFTPQECRTAKISK